MIEFCRFYERIHGELPKLLVFDGKLTTQEHLAELDEMGVGFITLRQRSPKLIATLEQLPASAWTKTRLDRSGKHRPPPTTKTRSRSPAQPSASSPSTASAG